MTSTPSRPRAETTIVHVAERAGVSIRTVSRVLNNPASVKAPTRERVQESMDALAFKPSARARGLATGRSFLLGLVHHDRNALVLNLVLTGLVEVAAAHGYELVVHSTPLDSADPVGDVVNFVQRSHVDGVIVLAPVSGISGLAAALNQLSIPTAAISSVPLDGFTFTTVTAERKAAARVAELLIGLGHRRIAMINGPMTTLSARERRAGFLHALVDAGMNVVAEGEGDYTFAAGLAAATTLLSLPVRPTAIFAANDIMAAAVLKIARQRSIEVPRDLSVVGFDGSVLAEMTTPALATVFRPMDRIARSTGDRLIALLEGKEARPEEQHDLTIMDGESAARVTDTDGEP